MKGVIMQIRSSAVVKSRAINTPRTIDCGKTVASVARVDAGLTTVYSIVAVREAGAVLRDRPRGCQDGGHLHKNKDV